jgi:DNA methylase
MSNTTAFDEARRVIGAYQEQKQLPEQRQIDSAYGALCEEIYFAAFSFERALQSMTYLLQAGRWKRCAAGFATVDDFLASLRMDDFKLVAEKRARVAALIRKADATISNRQIAKAIGVSSRTVDRDVAPNDATLGKNTNKNNKDAAPNGALSGFEAAKAAERAAIKAAAAYASEERREASRNAEPLPDGAELRIGDCRKMLADIPDNSVPLILTDPPYEGESEPLYRWLAEFAGRVLVPGGSLICYTGHWSVDRDMRIFGQHLRYWWLLIMMHHQSQRLPGKFIIANFKPVLWYVKNHRRGRSLVPDVLRSTARDKSVHNWAQGDGGISPLIEHLTEPGETIIDPFAGTATWGRHAAAMGRRWIGCDIAEGGTTTVVAAE